MLIIKQEQIDKFIMGSDEEFVEFLVNHLKEENPEAKTKYEDDVLREMVRNGIKRAQSHDLTTAEDLTAFVSIMYEIAPNFDEQPEIKAVLDDEKTLPEERIDKLWTPIVSDEAWENAEKNKNENAWFPHGRKEQKTEN